jgi:hypothetical protein
MTRKIGFLVAPVPKAAPLTLIQSPFSSQPTFIPPSLGLTDARDHPRS